MLPAQASGEDITIATECLNSICFEYINAGFPLWTRQFLLLGITVGSPDVTTPTGTVDVFHSYWRILNPYRGAATTSANSDASALFGGQPNSDVTIAGPNPSVTVNFGSATEVDTIGVLLGNTTAITTSLLVQGSLDGTTYTTVQTLPSTTFSPLAWSYFDLNPTITYPYLRLLYSGSGSWVLNQLNFGLANGQDIELGVNNIDDFFNLPDRQFQGTQPNTVYVDRQVASPVLKIWPTPDLAAFYNGTVTALVRRYIQDPGALTNNLEVPPRWLEAVTWRLASTLLYELPEPKSAEQQSYVALQMKQNHMEQLEKKAEKAEALMWSEERNRSPIKLVVAIRGYTA